MNRKPQKTALSAPFLHLKILYPPQTHTLLRLFMSIVFISEPCSPLPVPGLPPPPPLGSQYDLVLPRIPSSCINEEMSGNQFPHTN